jgi:hypothetical protein
MVAVRPRASTLPDAMELLLVAILVLLVLAGIGLVVTRRNRDATLEPPPRTEVPAGDTEVAAPVVEPAPAPVVEPAPAPEKPRFRDLLGKARCTLSGYLGFILSIDRMFSLMLYFL